MPYPFWIAQFDNLDPDLSDLVIRHAAVLAAIDRYRKAGLRVNNLWLEEVGLYRRKPCK
jgi:hypothetical protein